MAISIQRRIVSGQVLDAGIHPVLDRVYRGRGITSIEEVNNQAKRLLHYRALTGIERAVDLLVDAIQTDQHVVIVGDFDADGATSTALCVLALRAMGAKHVSYLVPNRFDMGYGLSPGIVDIAKHNGASLIVTVDSGIACVSGVSHAKDIGLDVIVTDHHLPPKELPPADAIVNPNLNQCDFPSKNLAGVGVAFYVLSALRARLTADGWFEAKSIEAPSMAQWLDIVAVGTVADVVVLDNNNRILVHQGLQRIRAGQCRPGIKAILDIANKEFPTLNATDLGFAIGPRLNAAGRLEDMSLGIECLLASDVFVAREKAAQLDSLNQQRKQIEKDMRVEAEKLVSELVDTESERLPHALVLFHDDFHQGIIGIVAGRLKEKFNRPVIAFASDDMGNIKGSARSVEGVHIRDAIEAVQQHSVGLIEKFGGHAMAAGLTLNKSNLEEFSTLFNRVIGSVRDSLPDQKTYTTDGDLAEEYLTLDFANTLTRAGPFGQGFPAPSFDDVFSLVSQRIVGEHHLKLVLRHSGGKEYDAIAFNIDTNIWPNSDARMVQVVYTPDVNVYRGKARLQLIIDCLLKAG